MPQICIYIDQLPRSALAKLARELQEPRFPFNFVHVHSCNDDLTIPASLGSHYAVEMFDTVEGAVEFFLRLTSSYTEEVIAFKINIKCSSV